MSANQVFLIVLAVFALCSFALSIFVLKLGLKWAEVSEVSFFRAFVLYLLILLIGCIVACCVLVPFMLAGVISSDLVLNIAAYVIQFLVGCFMIKWLYKARFMQTA